MAPQKAVAESRKIVREDDEGGPSAKAVPVQPRGRIRAAWLRLAVYRGPAIVALSLLAVGAFLRIASLGHSWHDYVVLSGHEYELHENPAASLLAGHGLRQLYGPFPSALPILVYPPGLPIVIAVLKFLFRPLEYESGMIPALSVTAFFILIVGLWAAGARRGFATSFREVWLSRAADGALPAMLPVGVALAAFPPLIALDLLPLGGAFAGALLVVAVFFLVRAQRTRSWHSAALAGTAFGFSTWFRMETYPVIILLTLTFLMVNVWRAGFSHAIRGLLIGAIVPFVVLSLYNRSVYGRFTAFPTAAHGLYSLLESCEKDQIVTDGREAEMNWTGTFGGYYFPDTAAVGPNIMHRAFQRLFRDVGIWKYAECGCNRIPGWLLDFEEGLSTEMRAASGIGWQPWSFPFTVVCVAGLFLAILHRPESAYLLLAVVFIVAVEAFLAPWFMMYHIHHILPLLLVGLVCLITAIVEDVPRWLTGRGLKSATAAVVAALLLLPLVFVSSAEGLGSPLDLTGTQRYQMATRWSSLPAGMAPQRAPLATIGNTIVNSATFSRAEGGKPFSLEADLRNAPPLLWLELHNHNVVADTAQYRFALRRIERAAQDVNHFVVHGEMTLPAWIASGTYDVVISNGAASGLIGHIPVSGHAPTSNLAQGQKVFFVPPPNWKDSAVSPDKFLGPDPDHAKALGRVFSCVGWLYTTEILSYVDLGHPRDIGGIVAHGSYGGWSGQVPENVEFAVSDDGLRWTTLPRPRLAALGDTPSSISSFHIGIDGLRVSGRYVRARFVTPSSSFAGITKWGLLRVNPGHLFLSGIDVYPR